MDDRSPRIEMIDDKLVEILRSKSPSERVAMILEANELARNLAAAGIRHQHSEWQPAQVQSEVSRRMLGDTR